MVCGSGGGGGDGGGTEFREGCGWKRGVICKWGEVYLAVQCYLMCCG